MKRCVISNYIPHKTPKKPDFARWLTTYYDDLLCLYNILNQIIMERHDEDRTGDEDFKRFTRFIYSCSSKHIQED